VEEKGIMSEYRDRYVPESEIWKRWRCDCGAQFTLTKAEALAKVRALNMRGDFFVVPCSCGVQHVFKKR
jgi:hypothetical protein